MKSEFCYPVLLLHKKIIACQRKRSHALSEEMALGIQRDGSELSIALCCHAKAQNISCWSSLWWGEEVAGLIEWHELLLFLLLCVSYYHYCCICIFCNHPWDIHVDLSRARYWGFGGGLFLIFFLRLTWWSLQNKCDFLKHSMTVWLLL